MAMDRFFIGPYDTNSGIQTNYRPWAIPEQAFQQLTNAYVFRGRVRKRFGSLWLGDSSLLSRFRIKIGTTDGGGNFTGTTPMHSTPAVIVARAIGQAFSIGTTVFTVNTLASTTMLRSDGSMAAATYDNSGNVVIQSSFIMTDVYFYPALPVMGLRTFENINVNNETIIGFDTSFAYGYSSGWDRLSGEMTANASIWTGTDSEFFWTTTWTGTNASDKVFFVTNFNENEPNFMRTFFNNKWDNFRPPIDGTNFLNSARILVPFKNRLIALNTWEGSGSPGTQYPNRARYSQVGSPLDTQAWRQDIPGRGNAIDCATTEAIVTAEFVKDRLIVYFERSTWELVYTGNQAYPFTWQQINTELGAESTFSIVPFDKVAIGIGNVGIHACSGVNVDRIDQLIPDTVFDIHNSDDGIFRVYGIRDYNVEMVYWTFPGTDATADFKFPSRVLVYNYKTGSWAFNEDSITAFGYYQPSVGITWDSQVITWDDPVSWDSGFIQSRALEIIAGNQEGYTFIVDAEAATNAAVLQITDMSAGANNVITITCINNNLRIGQFVLLTGITQSTDPADNLTLLNYKVFKVTSVTTNTFTIVYPDSNVTIQGTYAGGGLIARVSNLYIQTKDYNFYLKQGRNAAVSKIDFMVDKTDVGQINVDFFVSTSGTSMITAGGPMGTGMLIGTQTLDTFPYPTIPLEVSAVRLWHPVYFNAQGECISFLLSMSDEQMMDITKTINPDMSVSLSGPALEDFQLHAIVIFAQPTSYRLE
jgi:hypothetical protein